MNIAKYEHKHGIDLSKLTPASAPKAKPKAKIKVDTKKQQEIDAAWKEYTSKQNVPTTEQIFAQRNAEAAKLKQEQVSQAWAEHTTAPKQTSAKTEQNIADIFAQRKAEEAALKKQQMDEMWAAAGY